jgi:hypothetical protein
MGGVIGAPTLPANRGEKHEWTRVCASISFVSLELLTPSMKCFRRLPPNRLPLPSCCASPVCLPQEQVSLRCARNATSMNHLLAHFSDIVARMLQDLAKERSGERKKNERRCYARLCEKADSLEAPGSVARFLRNRKFYLINDNDDRHDQGREQS